MVNRTSFNVGNQKPTFVRNFSSWYTCMDVKSDFFSEHINYFGPNIKLNLSNLKIFNRTEESNK